MKVIRVTAKDYANLPKGANSQNLSRYNVVSFLPKFLFQQLSQLSTLYFLGIALLQQIPDLSPTGRWGTLSTLSILLFLSMIREIIEDLRKRKADLKINRQRCSVFRDGDFGQERWSNLTQGDVIELQGGDKVPADCIIAASNQALGTCYLETSSIDGESNLKLRQAPIVTRKCQSAEELVEAGMELQISSHERREFNVFHGRLSLGKEVEHPLDLACFLPRGAAVVNTEWVMAVVVAVGHDTKLIMNTVTRSHGKHSRCDKLVNQITVTLLMVLLALCMVLAGMSVLVNAEQNLVDFFTFFFRYLILFHNIIPVSLLATIQMVRLVQSHFITQDDDIYSETYEQKPKVQNSQLNEMLGQVEYIFADKTGTITKNQLIFKKCYVDQQALDPNHGSHLRDVLSRCQCTRNLLSACPINCVAIKDMFLAMSLCHTVIPGRGSGEEVGDHLVLIGSPDEKAVLEGARMFGITYFHDRGVDNSIEIFNALGALENFEVLGVLEYTSSRKRMSIVTKRRKTGEVLVFAKGADSAIIPLLRRAVDDDVTTTLESFATQGLRTMCYAMKVLDLDQLQRWTSLMKQGQIDTAMAIIESDLDFLGLTGVEDELQDNVRSSVSRLLDEDINIWMLSGDRQENAVSIAKSAGLLRKNEVLILLPDVDLEESRAICLEHLQKLDLNQVCQGAFSMVLSGRTIAQTQDCETIKEALMSLCTCANTVICFRVDPGQKAELVRLARLHCARDKVTLAIGDGSNDVPMLEAAHIGISISGVPGDQVQIHGNEAGCVADYSIAEFSGIIHLMFGHGVWNFLRLKRMIGFFFYKNIIFYGMQLFNVPWTGWSGQILFDSLSMTMYNVVFTSFPPLVLCLANHNRLRNLGLKVIALRKGYLAKDSIWQWIISALIHATITFTFFSASFYQSAQDNVDVFQTSIYTAMLVIVSAKAVTNAPFLSLSFKLVLFISIFWWLLYCFIFNFHFSFLPIDIWVVFAHLIGVFTEMTRQPWIWLVIVLVLVTCLTLDLTSSVLSHWSLSKAKARGVTKSRQSLAQVQAIVRTLPRAKSRAQIRDLAHGFAFSETSSTNNVGEPECVKAYTKSLGKPRRRRPSLRPKLSHSTC